MQTDPLAPAVDTPPRTLHDWTTVEGHTVTEASRGRARCSCGEAQPIHELLQRVRRKVGHGHNLSAAERGEVRAAATAWRAQHLANAWPVLIQRLEGEALEQLADRVREALETARAERDRLEHDALADGDPIPVISEAQMEAGMRAAVLRHQYQQVAEKLRRLHEIDGTDEAIKWLVESIGDPLDEL